MRAIHGLALAAFLAMVVETGAAPRLVVMAINSGTGTTSNSQPPSATPGAKGFLLGIDSTSEPPDPLAFKDLTFTSAGFGGALVQRLAPNAVAMGELASPNVQTRSEAILANFTDDPDTPAGTTFAANDSWWWDTPYTVGTTTLTLAPVSTGIQGGLPGGPMTMTGSHNLFGNVPPGVWPVAYVVTTGDVIISGILASGPNGFGPAGGAVGETISLDYETGQLSPPLPTYWINPAGGSFGIGPNWSNGVPIASNGANFELSETYTVSFNAGSTSKFFAVRRGEVTLDLNGFTYQLTADPFQVEPISVQVFGGLGSSAALRIVDGNLNSVYASIGYAGFTESGAATIGAGATWNNSADFYAGGNSNVKLGMPCQLVVEDGGALVVGGSIRVDSGSTITLLEGTIHAGSFQVRAAASPLRVGLGGTDPNQFGQLSVTGQASLAGTFDVDLLDGFMPALGDTFEVMTFGSRSGDFGSYTGLNVGGHLTLQRTFTPHSLVLKAIPAVSGDINLDGVVDMYDVNNVSLYWGTSGPQGDANGDGTVDIFDINAISANWGATDPGGAQAVPEPGAIVLFCLGAVLMLVFRRRGIAW